MTESQQSDVVSKALYGIIGTVIGVLITYVTAISQHSEDIARLTERIENLTLEVRSGMDDRYRASDALRDLQLRDERIEHNVREIEAIKERLHRAVK